MKLFPAKRHERATLRKLWRQTGNSSLLPAKCWLLLHVIRARSWRLPDVVARISPRFSKFAFVLFCFITNHLMTGPLGNTEFCFPRLRLGKHWDSRETKFTVPLGTSHWVFNITRSNIWRCFFSFFNMIISMHLIRSCAKCGKKFQAPGRYEIKMFTANLWGEWI